jgi:hypothetical protein
MKNLLRLALWVVLVTLAGRMTGAQSDTPARGSAHPADSIPRDQHEGLTIAADSYHDPSRAREKFGKADPVAVGILPVEVFLINATAQPIRIDVETVQLDVRFESGQHQNVDWLPLGEVARKIAHPNGPSNPHPPRIPIGVDTGADAKTDKILEILRPFALDVSVVPPMATLHGFLFFDLSHNMSLAERASLYVPDVTNVPQKKPLMFFEVALGKS